jgi:choice-of-anchor A domain-containing protein
MQERLRAATRAVAAAAALMFAACLLVGCAHEHEPVGTTAQAITLSAPYRVRALDYVGYQDTTSQHYGNCGSGAVDAETTSDAGSGGCNIGWTAPGEWLDYSIQFASAGKFHFVPRVASAASGKSFRLLLDGQDVSGAISLPNAGWQAFESRTVRDVSVSAGTHTLRVQFDTGEANLAYVDVAPGSVELPARLEGEAYQRANESTASTNSGGACDRRDGVDKETTGDTAGGGCNIGWTTPGEWLEYDLSAAQAGVFDITARVGSALTGKTVRLSLDGTDLGVVSVPSGGWTKFEDRTLVDVSVSAGAHVLRVTFPEGDANLNYLNFAAEVPPVQPPTGDVDYSFGAAKDFNVFVFGDLTGTPSIAGPVAAGRDIIASGFGYNFNSVGTIGAVAGRTFNGANGSVHRDLVYGTSKVLSGFGVVDGVVRQGTPIDFDAERQNLTAVSSSLTALAVNGTTTADAWGTVVFTGSDPELNVFTVASATVASSDVLRVSVPSTSTVVINVSGSSPVFETTGMDLGSLAANRLLWNFSAATSLRLSQTGFKGVMLAPNAAVSQNGVTFEGQLFASSLAGGDSGVIWVPFEGELPSDDICDATGCLRTLTVEVPAHTTYDDYAIVADGALELKDEANVLAPVANMGGTWTQIGSDVQLSDVWSKPQLTVGEGTHIDGFVRTGGASTISSSAAVRDGTLPAEFEPPSQHAITFDIARENAGDVVVPAGEERTLPPGAYGSLTLDANARVLLESGDYFFEAFESLAVNSVFQLNEQAGPVRILVGRPFTFRGRVTSSSEPARLLVAALGTGEVRLESPFEGMLVAPEAKLVLAPLNGAAHAAAFFAKDVTVDVGVTIEPLPSGPISCKYHEFRDAETAACSGHGLELLKHEGVTRAIFEGFESFEVGKRVEPVEDFTFTFDQPISLDKASAAVQVLSVACPEEVLPPGCTDDVELDVSHVAGDERSVRFRNAHDPFLPGCRYELRINDSPLSSSGQCLAAPKRLHFVSLEKTDGPALSYEAEHLRQDSRHFRVAAVDFKDTIVWEANELFRERAEALGLRPDIDGFAPSGAARPSGYAPGAESIFYQQQVGGVPIDGRGYTVQRDATTGRVIQITGRVASDVPVPSSPALSEATALTRAQAEVPGVPTTSAGTLRLLVPAHDGSGTFKQAYRFSLQDQEGLLARLVDIDASSGDVLASVPGIKSACSSVDVSTLKVPDPTSSVMPVELETLQSRKGEFDPTTLYVTEYTQSDGARAYALDSRGGELLSGVNLATPALYTVCPSKAYPEVVALPGEHSDASWDPETLVAAQLQLAGQSCIDFFANRPRGYGIDGAPWSGFDGLGLQGTQIQLDPTKPVTNAFYGNGKLIFNPAFVGGAAIDVACHEFTHGIWAHLGLDSTNPEARALDESMADIFGSAAEYAKRADEDSLWCFYAQYDNVADESTLHDCSRWMDAPTVSSPPQPYVYRGPNYCEGNACDPHIDSGVMNYWFFLVAKGGASVGNVGCGYDVKPLDPDSLKNSVDMATEIVFTALRDGLYIPGGGFADMASGTIGAAFKLYGEGPVVDTVTAAWHAVNLWEYVPETNSDWIGPANGATGVDPWSGFSWPMPEGIAQSDIQVDLFDTFASNAGNPLWEATVDTEFFPEIDGSAPDPEIGVTVGMTRQHELDWKSTIGLEPNTTYFWRTRPHSAEPWGNCDVVHSFTTGDAPIVQRLYAPNVLDPQIDPGTLKVLLHEEPTALQYKVQISSHDTDCKSDPAVEEHIVDDAPPAPVGDHLPWENQDPVYFEDLDAEQEYWLNIQTLGPPDANGDTTTGGCFKMNFRTRALEAPTLLSPENGSVSGYFDPAKPLEWRVGPGTETHLVRLYEIDEGGACGKKAVYSRTLDDPCDSGHCEVSLDIGFDLPNPRNPSGYCWDVVAGQTNLVQPKASGTFEFKYRINAPVNLDPGSEHWNDVNFALEGDSYGQPVTLEWDPLVIKLGQFEVPLPVSYGARVGRQPWIKTSRGIPPTCEDFLCKLASRDETRAPTTTSTPALGLAPEEGGMGRYCWTVWPVLEDPNRPGKNWSRQPIVSTAPPLCYTTGPSEPRITITNPEAGDHIYEGDYVRGTIDVDYVPEGQIAVVLSEPDNHVSLDWSGCRPEEKRPGEVYFADIHACHIEFSAWVPDPGAFQMAARTSNAPHPQGGVYYSQYQVHEALSEIIYVDPCGEVGEPCCADQWCADRSEGFYCNPEGMCEQCGDKGEDCCGDLREPGTEWCNGADIDCGTNRKCVDCGGAYQICCQGSCDDEENYDCEWDPDLGYRTCQSCGELGQTCCDEGPRCNGGHSCEGDRCGAACDREPDPVQITFPDGPSLEYDYQSSVISCSALRDLVPVSNVVSWKNWSEIPGSPPVDEYELYFAPGGETFTVPGDEAGKFLGGLGLQTTACGALGVFVRAVNGCGTSSVEDESGVVFRTQ